MKSILISLLVLSIFSILIIFILFFILIKKSLLLRKTKESLEFEKQSYECLANTYDGIRGFRHDFSNIMQSISGYLLTDDLVGLKNYYSSIFHECEEIKQSSVLNKEVINCPPVLSLLSRKYKKAQEANIKFNIEIFSDLNKLNISSYEFTRILGIFLDNSIEACQNCSEKNINVIIARNSIEKYDYLIVENSINPDSNINLDNIFKKDFSTKPQNSGIGLWKVKNIVNKNNSLSLDTTISENNFKHILKIFY